MKQRKENKMEKMTKREFLTLVLGYGEVLPVEAVEYAKVEIEKLEKANARKRSSAKKAKPMTEEEQAIYNAVIEFLGQQSEPIVAKEIRTHLVDNGHEVSAQKLNGLLTKGANKGEIEKTVPKERNKSILYQLVNQEVTAEEEQTEEGA